MALPPELPVLSEFVSKRPTQPRIFKDEVKRQPDLVIEWDEDNIHKTFVCYRKMIKGDENCWRIFLTITKNKASLELEGPNGQIFLADPSKITRLLYPYGCDGYNFNPNHIMLYDWQYQY